MCTNENVKVASLVTVIVVFLFILYSIPKVPHIIRLWKSNILVKNTTRCVIVLRERSGRLGNRLFMFASAYGLSLNRSCQLYIDSNIITELQESFEINLPNLLPKSQLNRSTPIEKISNHCSFFPHLLHSNNSYSIELLGYWQVYKYFIDYTDKIREQLRFQSRILDRANSFLNKTINRTISTLVGIHIRRGDFLIVRRVSSDKYIFNAMSYFLTKYHSVIFIIISDDKQYCRKVFGQKTNVLLTPDSFSPADDLATLTLCEHTIITVGSFGWWGAFLLHNRTGDVLTDSKPDHSPLETNCRRDDFFPPWFLFLNNTN